MAHIFVRSLTLMLAATCSTLAFAQAESSSASPASAPDAAAGEIVVTAQKRQQSINDVGLTVTAATADTLQARGIADTGDLAKIVPGFTATNSPYATPVYTLRGIGLYDYSLGSSPSVAVYVDEIARPFPVTQMGVTLDLERVEVLKGPQGTLFGQSSTGGAVNYIAAKPTDHLSAGFDASYERFGRADLSAFVSGPLAPSLNARLSARAVTGGAWQRSISRPGDRNGDSDLLMGRLLVDWEPSSTVRFSLNVNGVRDKSETQQPQFSFNQLNIVGAPGSGNPFEQVNPAIYAGLTTPGSPNYDPSFVTRQAFVYNRLIGGGLVPGAAILPSDPTDTAKYLGGPNGDGRALCDHDTDRCIRQADWSADWPTSSNDSYYQFALRAEWDLSDALTLTSLSSYQKSKIDKYYDNDATTATALNERLFGNVRNFSQELRISGKAGGVNWIVGGNYDWSKVDDNVLFITRDLSLNEVFPGMRFDNLNANLRQKIETYAVFANVDWALTDRFSVQGGIRYTKSKRRGGYCSTDGSDEQFLSQTFGNDLVVPGFGFLDLQTAFGLDPAGHRVVRQGQCYVLDDQADPTGLDYLRPTLDPYVVSLEEDNVSFRAGANYKFDGGSLLYATVSQGYKSGVISGISGSVTSQYTPAKQEKVVAYEAGLKAPLADRRLQFNVAGFYYDYSDKQVRARVLDPIFGLLEQLVNVPKSYVWGLETEIVAQPAPGLDLSLSGTYLKSKVDGSFATVNGKPIYNQQGYTGDYDGSPLPYTPKFSGVFDGQYEARLTDGVNAFIGTTVTYAAKDNTTFYNDILLADQYVRRAHTLVDMRAGVADPNGGWRVTAFVRNLTNQYYETSLFTGTELGYRYAGKPRVFGLQLRLRTR